MKIPFPSQRGYTSIEILVAALFLIVVLTPVINSLFGSAKASANAMANTRATARGRELMDQIRACRWDENGNAPIPAGQRSAIGADSGELTVGDFDDIDDFNGYADEVASLYDAMDLSRFF